RERTKILSLGRTARGILSDEKGLSLFELIIVLLIIGLVAALSAPAIHHGWQNLQVKRAATSLAALLRYAHRQAILTKETHIVRIDLDGHLTQLLRTNPSGPVVEDGEPAGQRPLSTLRFPASVRPRLIDPQQARVIDSGQRDLLFYPTGHSTSEAIELVNVRGTVYRIVIDPVTGTPTVSREAS
ncbi:MAG: prepilin-type N-terminal cleavage/methylation domain-containing protein, partial [Nitrospinota bacterium]